MKIKSLRKCIWLFAFVVIWLALRAFWLSGDPGVPSQWEYGYNATDEGYYLDGGKEKLLWGTFTDLSRTEAFTYGYSPGTHLLSYLAHLCFGLSSWTWRIPFIMISLVAWCALFRHVAARRSGAFAFLACVPVAIVPMVVAYERTASNDVLISSLTALAYVVGAGRGKWRPFFAAAIAAAVVLVKPSVWLILPIALAGVLSERKFRTAWIDASAFVVSAVAFVFLFKLFAAFAVRPDAAREGCSIFEIIRRTTTHYPLPSLFAISDHLRGLSSFPRDPSGTMLGVLPAFLLPLPMLLFFIEAVRARNVSRMLLFASIPAYVGAVSVMNTIYTHYFMPVVMMLPALVLNGADTLRDIQTADFERKSPPVQVFSAALLAVLAVGALLLFDFRIKPETAQAVYSRVYNFPQKTTWTATWVPACVIMIVALGMIAAFGGRRRLKDIAIAALPLAAASSVVCAYLPAVSIAPFMKASPLVHGIPMILNYLAGVGLCITLVVMPSVGGRGIRLPVILFAMVAIGYAAMPNWRVAAAELVARPTHLHREVAEELLKILPADAIVIGERSNQMLMSLPIRTATTFPSNSDPIPVIRRVTERYPGAPLFALADSQHAYNLQHFREHAREYRLDLVKEFKMPSFANGQPASVFLCRIVQLPQSQK